MTVDHADTFTLAALDGGAAVDATYTGTVTFSAGCGDCFTITPNNGAGNEKKFTLGGTQAGDQDFSITWKPSSAVGSQTLTASDGVITNATAPSTVTSNAATKIDVQNVDTAPTVGGMDSFSIAMRNANDETGADYTGTVTFTASCGDCFSISSPPGGNPYTFVPADAGAKTFTLIWKTAALSPPNRTFTAEGTGGVTSETVPDIDVGQPVSPTTTPGGGGGPTTTTSTTIAPHVAEPMLITGAGPGGGPHVIARAADNKAVLFSFYAYGANFTGGVRVAAGDVNNDGFDDIITAPGPGGGPHVRVFSGKTGGVIAEFMAYDTAFTGGVFVASADVNNDGKADIITGPDAGGGPHVKIFSGAAMVSNPTASAETWLLGQFMAYSTSFHGGVRVAAGDFDEDGKADIVTGAGPGGGPHVRVLHADGSEVAGLPPGGFYAYGASFTGGVYVAADPSNVAVIITGAGAGGGRHVRVFDIDAKEELGFIAAGANYGAIPAIGNSDTDAGNILLLSRAVTDPTVQILGLDGHEVSTFPAYSAGIGVFVAVGVL